MTTTVDARGLPCPQPVILTRKAMQQADEVITLVTGADQVDNVRRLAEKAGWRVAVEQGEGGYALHLTKGGDISVPAPAPEAAASTPTGATVLLVPSTTMGRGSDELGDILVRAFFHTLGEIEPLPATIIFVNTGVQLTAEGSSILEDLRALEAGGLDILVCGTCLGYFDLKERIAVGTISNMYTIAETLLGAGHVVSL